MSALTEYRLTGAPGRWQFWAEAEGDGVWIAAMDTAAAYYLERLNTTGQDAYPREGSLLLVPRAKLVAVGTDFHQPPLF